MTKQLINEAKRFQELAGIKPLNENQENNGDYYIDGTDEIESAFEQSPNEHSYEELLDVVDSYEDEKHLESFTSTFQPGQSISKEEWVRWSYSVSDYDPEGYVYLNWISLSDPDIYTKAGKL